MKWYWEYGAIAFWFCIGLLGLWMISKALKLLG